MTNNPASKECLSSLHEEHSKKYRKAYQPPQLRILDTRQTSSGDANVPETNNGLLES